MSYRRLFIAAAVLILSISGISTRAAEKENSAQTTEIVYTPQELCCMAKYYYKKTSMDGYYPPEAEYREEADGTYTIDLRERIEDGKDEFHYATYAWYNVKDNGKGEDTILGTPVDLTKYSKVYTPEQLCKLAQDYYYLMYDFYPPNATFTANSDGTYTICLFEVIKEEDGGVEHSATCGWFTVDVCGMGQDDIMLQAVDINP